MACLELVAPVGMDEAARTNWLKIAWLTVKHLPADLLSIGAAKARETADHPSKIVPAILRETDELMRQRRQSYRENARIPESHQLAAPEPCTPEQARAVLDQFGIPPLDAKPVTTNRAPLRKPTRQDYLDMGVSPETLDSIG